LKNPETRWLAGEIDAAVETPALRRLAAYERLHRDVLGELEEAEARLSALRKEGREKSATFRQTLGQKLLLAQFAQRLSQCLKDGHGK